MAIFLFLVALAIRTAYLLQFSESPIFTNPVGPDVEEYDLWARQIVAGNFLWSYVHIHGPLYPFVLAFEYWLFAFNHFHVRFFQLMIGLASAIPVLIALRIIHEKWTLHNLILGAIWALYPPLIYYQAEYISETMLIPLLCVSICLLYLAEKSEKHVNSLYASAGIAAGLAVITHPMSGFFVLLEIFYLLFLLKNRFTVKVRNAFVFAAVATLAVAPVSYYNYFILGKLAPVQANSGFNFYLGNNPDADGTCYLRPGPEWSKVHERAQKTASAVFVSKDSYFLSESWNFIKNHPLLWTNLLLQKALYTWSSDELTSGADPGPLKYYTPIQSWFRWSFAVVAILALTGIFMNIRNRSFLYDYRHFLLLILAFWLAQIFFVTSARYRLAMLPGIFVIAAFTLDYIIINRRTFFTAILPYAGIAVAIVILPAPRVSPDMEKAEAYTLLGESYIKSGNLPEAESCLLKASDPMYKWSRSYNLLGLLSEKKNNIAAAEKYYLKAVNCEDSDPYGLMNLAVIYSEKNDFGKANAYFVKALAVDNENADIHYNYAFFLSKFKGNAILAERHYWDCLKLNPAHRKALNNMGLFQMQKGKYSEAVKYFSRAHSLEPGNPDLIVNLAVANLADGEETRAEKLLRKALAINANHRGAKELLKIIDANRRPNRN
ncbi:MAG: hypothetical protein A2X48_11590 [Lentisphaerae bacterium GWF2_49_21]|nr:MAG: hypothetical protein A2X48_11590 [Lentisphaerae bacterium GWF2_49_21]